MKCIKNFIICYIWRRISVLRHFFELKILKTLGDTKYICTFVLGTMNNCQPNKFRKESINISNLYKNLSNKLKLW